MWAILPLSSPAPLITERVGRLSLRQIGHGDSADECCKRFSLCLGSLSESRQIPAGQTRTSRRTSYSCCFLLGPGLHRGTSKPRQAALSARAKPVMRIHQLTHTHTQYSLDKDCYTYKLYFIRLPLLFGGVVAHEDTSHALLAAALLYMVSVTRFIKVLLFLFTEETSLLSTACLMFVYLNKLDLLSPA